MKVSIITVSYNSASTIRDTIDSVMLQDYQNIEYIVVDGASTDSTMQIVDEYRNNISSVISEVDSGIYEAMNKGVALATGDIIGILNSDDFFPDGDVISRLVRCFLENPLIEGVYGDLVYVDKKQVHKVTRKFSSLGFRRWKMRFGIAFPHPTFYVKKEVYQQLGRYNLKYEVAADFEFMVRCVLHGVKLMRNDRVMVRMREGGASTGGIAARVNQNLEIVQACKENGIYTNIFLVGLKLPFKLLGYLMK